MCLLQQCDWLGYCAAFLRSSEGVESNESSFQTTYRRYTTQKTIWDTKNNKGRSKMAMPRDDNPIVIPSNGPLMALGAVLQLQLIAYELAMLR